MSEIVNNHKPCKHPPNRHFAIVADNEHGVPKLFVRCCECGKTLVNGGQIKKAKRQDKVK